LTRFIQLQERISDLERLAAEVVSLAERVTKDSTVQDELAMKGSSGIEEPGSFSFNTPSQGPENLKNAMFLCIQRGARRELKGGLFVILRVSYIDTVS
jgi:hypothetical protein